MTLSTIDESLKVFAFSGDEDENVDPVKEESDGLEGLDEDEEKDPEEEEKEEDDEDEEEGE